MNFVMFCFPPSTKLLQLFSFLFSIEPVAASILRILYFVGIPSILLWKKFGMESKKHKSPLYCYEEGQHDFHIRIASNSNAERASAHRQSPASRSNEMRTNETIWCREALRVTMLGIWAMGIHITHTMIAHGE